MFGHAPIQSSGYNPANDAPVRDEMTSIGVHPEEVYHWRCEQFERLGFAEHQVAYLATHRVDLHAMEGLLSAGCAHELALRILTDTAFNGEDETDYASIVVVQDVLEAPTAS